MCNDRVSVGLEPACIKACPTGCLHFGTKSEMKELAETRAEQLREHSGFADAGVYDPPGVGGTHVIYVPHCTTQRIQSCKVALAERSAHVPYSVRLWKGSAGSGWGIWEDDRRSLAGLAWHYMRYGPKKVEPIPPEEQRRV